MTVVFGGIMAVVDRTVQVKSKNGRRLGGMSGCTVEVSEDLLVRSWIVLWKRG